MFSSNNKNILKDPSGYGEKKRRGWRPKITERSRISILRTTSRTWVYFSQIVNDLKFNVNSRTVRQILQRTPNMKWDKIKNFEPPWSKSDWKLLGAMVRIIYLDKRQYQTINGLNMAMFSVCNHLSVEQLEKLVQSMSNRIFEVIQKNGSPTRFWMCALILRPRIQICSFL